MSFEQDPNESANISGADFAQMCDEMKSLRAELAEARAAKSDNLIKAVEDLTKFSDLLQDCHSLFLKIADEDDKEQFEINQDLRRKLDALCLKIQQET